jgi:hypothetical protein
MVIIGRIQPSWRRRALCQSMNGRALLHQSIRALRDTARLRVNARAEPK